MNPLSERTIGMIFLFLILLILTISEWRKNRKIPKFKVRVYPLTPDQTFDNLEPATENELIQDDLEEAGSCLASALYRVQNSDHNQRVKHEIYLKEMIQNITWLLEQYPNPAPIEEYPTYTQHKQNQ